MVEECVEYLVTDKGFYVDGTLGGGGHTARLLETGATVASIDRDPAAIRYAQNRFKDHKNWFCLEANFAEGVKAAVDAYGGPADGVLLDLGMSSRQLDDAQRGFSYRWDAPLDMRMDPESAVTAATLANEWEETALRRLFKDNDEPRANKIAKTIVNRRPIETTFDLVAVVDAVVPSMHRVKTLARVFQALRIQVNDELGHLDRILRQLPDLVKPGGRLVVLSYHSLEDRRVKRTLKSGDPYLLQYPQDHFGTNLAPWRSLLPKGGSLTPSDDEILANPRARSAKLRAAQRTTFPSSVVSSSSNNNAPSSPRHRDRHRHRG